MKSGIPAPATDQLTLGLHFDNFLLERSDGLLRTVGLRVSLAPHEFGFNFISAPPDLSFVSLDKSNALQISASLAQERLADPDHVRRQEVTPLCLWAIDSVLGYRIQSVGQVSLPERPNPGKKLMILTQGKFTDNGGSEGSEYAQNVFLKERDDGGFDVCTISKYDVFMLYRKPTWDLVALCAPSSLCTNSTALSV